MALEIGSRLGHYDVTALIGEGGMGEVYRARDTKLIGNPTVRISAICIASRDRRSDMSSGFRSFTAAFLSLVFIFFLAAHQPLSAQEQPPSEIDYLLLASNKTSTMQEEMQEAAEAGYAFVDVMGGETSFGGSEVVVMMQRLANSTPRFAYRLLATTKTSTMQKELQEAGEDGFSYRGQTIFSSTFGGDEAVVILERNKDLVNPPLFEYRVLATKKTSTMQKELREAGAVGFQYVGVTVASTAFGGDEIVAILRRPVPDSEG